MQTTELLEHFDPATDSSEEGEADFMPACIAGCELDVEADFELAFVDLVRSCWNNPATVIAFKEAVTAAKGEA
jgi:hypothetical protein